MKIHLTNKSRRALVTALANGTLDTENVPELDEAMKRGSKEEPFLRLMKSLPDPPDHPELSGFPPLTAEDIKKLCELNGVDVSGLSYRQGGANTIKLQ